MACHYLVDTTHRLEALENKSIEIMGNDLFFLVTPENIIITFQNWNLSIFIEITDGPANSRAS